MRIRSIKPDFWRSPDITQLDLPERLLFIGLWSYVDDNGVGQDRVATVAADLFADDLERDPRETLARISGGLQKLADAGRIVRYIVAERPFLYIVNWDKHQRIDKPNKPRYPLPTSEDAVIRESVARPARECRDIPAPGAVEQGNRGAVEQGTSPAVPEVTHQGGREVARRGSRASRRINELNSTSRSAEADRFAAEFNRWAGGGIPVQARIEIAQEVDQLIADGISPHQIADGVKAWHASDRLYASQIPAFVTKAARSAEPQPKPTKATLRAVDTLAATEALIAEFRETA